MAVADISPMLAAFGAIYAAWLMLALAVQLPAHARWVRVRADRRLTPRLLGRWEMPRWGVGGFAVVATLLLGALAATVASGGTSAVALLAAAGAALFYFPQVIALPAVKRKPGTVPVILLILGMQRLAGNQESTAAMAVLAIKLVVAQIYLGSAVMKLRTSGWGWASGATLQRSLLRYHLRDDSAPALALAARPLACRWVAALVLGFELTFWCVIPWPPLIWVYLPLGLLFHLGTAVVMRIHYWIYVLPAYAIFFVGR